MNNEKDTELESLIENEQQEEPKKKKFKIDWVAVIALLIAFGFIWAIVCIVADTVSYIKTVDLTAPEAVVETTECTSAPDTEPSSANETSTEPIDILPEPTETIPVETTEPTVEETKPTTKPKPTEPKPSDKKEPVVEETKPSTEPSTESSPEPETLTKEEVLYNYITDKLGYSPAAACGIIANIAYETGWKFNPDVGDIDYGAYGLIQWMGNRRKKLKSWCEETGRDWRTMEGQLDFMDWELKNDDPYGTYDKLLKCADSAKGAYNAGWNFCYWYERPNRVEKASEWRGNYAKKYYKSLVLGEE